MYITWWMGMIIAAWWLASIWQITRIERKKFFQAGLHCGMHYTIDKYITDRTIHFNRVLSSFEKDIVREYELENEEE